MEKIENINLNYFKLGKNYVINRDKSLRLSAKKPSIKMRHLKKEKKVIEALRDYDACKYGSNDFSVFNNWYSEVKKRFPMNRTMTYYRGYKKTGKVIFAEADRLAKTFMKLGYNVGDEITCFMSNVPEVLPLMLAASKCGMVVRFIGADFEPNLIYDTLKNNSRKLIFATDDKYNMIAPIIDKLGINANDSVILVSLTDSLKDGIDPFKEYDDNFYEFKNKVDDFKKKYGYIMTMADFSKLGDDYTGIYPSKNINLPFTITYTSGSTKIGRPKAIIHTNKHYCLMGRFREPDLSVLPPIKSVRSLAQIPMHSNTSLSTTVSDVLCMGWSVAFEPVFTPDFFPYCLLINEPN